MRLFVLALPFLSVFGSPATAAACTPQDVAPLVGAVFASLGHDCPGYVSLFASDARYYHPHDGYKTYPELPENCQNYARFCPGNDCRFLQNGAPAVVSRGNSCQILVPYLGSELPANHRAANNLEPHTGREHIVATPSRASSSGYAIHSFAEIESSYSMAFNWRQQGDAVVLAAGGLCHVAVPYAAQVGAGLRTGRIVFTLQPTPNHAYLINDAVEFPQPLTWDGA